MEKKEIQKLVDDAGIWYHKIDLPHGVVTPGHSEQNHFHYYSIMKLPESLKNSRCLDIGACDGYFSFRMEKDGGDVTAIDNLRRNLKPDEVKYLDTVNKPFETAKEALRSKVVFFNMDIEKPDFNILKDFDVVLFLGVLYHLQNPMLALSNIYNVMKVGGVCVIETEFIRTTRKIPLIRYAPGKSYNQDPTNFFFPNEEALLGMVVDSGFKKPEIIYKSPIKPKSIARLFLSGVFNGRIMIKVYK